MREREGLRAERMCTTAEEEESVGVEVPVVVVVEEAEAGVLPGAAVADAREVGLRKGRREGWLGRVNFEEERLAFGGLMCR